MISKFKPRAALLMLLAFFYVSNPTQSFGQSTERLTASGTTMGVVTWNATAFHSNDMDSNLRSKFEAAIAEELESVNQQMSTYIDDSDVSRFNASQSSRWIPVSKDTAVVVKRALDISIQSEGAFDITVRPLVQLWKFGTDKENPVVPDQETIEKLLRTVGYANLQVQLDPPALRKTIPELQIDLSAIAKGYAVDQVHQRLVSMGYENLLVEVGGELRASGEKPDKSAWKVGIEKPIGIKRESYRSVELFHKSLASSGDYRNFYEIDGKRYSHTIDPRTGKPVTHGVASASVIAGDCMTADALATALMVLGPQKGIELAKKMGVEALVLTRNGGFELIATETDSFPGVVTPKKQNDNSIFRMIAIASLFFLVAIIAMAVGVIFGRERIKGSCGGIAALDNPDISPECSLCSRAAECNDLKKEVKKRGEQS